MYILKNLKNDISIYLAQNLMFFIFLLVVNNNNYLFNGKKKRFK